MAPVWASGSRMGNIKLHVHQEKCRTAVKLERTSSELCSVNRQELRLPSSKMGPRAQSCTNGDLFMGGEAARILRLAAQVIKGKV